MIVPAKNLGARSSSPVRVGWVGPGRFLRKFVLPSFVDFLTFFDNFNFAQDRLRLGFWLQRSTVPGSNFTRTIFFVERSPADNCLFFFYEPVASLKNFIIFGNQFMINSFTGILYSRILFCVFENIKGMIVQLRSRLKFWMWKAKKIHFIIFFELLGR